MHAMAQFLSHPIQRRFLPRKWMLSVHPATRLACGVLERGGQIVAHSSPSGFDVRQVAFHQWFAKLTGQLGRATDCWVIKQQL